MIIEEIEGLISQVNEKFDTLCVLGSDTKERKALLRQALEDIDIFQKTMLFELRKALE